MCKVIDDDASVDIFDVIAEINEEALSIDGLDDCIIGMCSVYGNTPIIAYDTEKIINTLRKRDGMTIEEAQEYFEFNISGSYVGENTPVFIAVLNET